MSISEKRTKLAALRSREEFDGVLENNTQIRSAYFVLHYRIKFLSTKTSYECCSSVDKRLSEGAKLGLIIPKRFARSAVTRSLIKRRCRAQISAFIPELPVGCWIIRLKRPIDSKQWKSSSSPELKKFISMELQSLFSKAVMQLNAPHEERWQKGLLK